MSDQSDRVRDFFDVWADNGRAEGMEASHGHAARHAFDALELSPGQRYLDIGCGNGYTVRWAAAVDPTVDAIGIDVAERMVARAQAQSSAIDNASFRVATWPDPSFADASIDRVLSMEVFYYLADIDAGLAAVARALSPGGRFGCAVDFYGENTASHSWPEDIGVAMTLWSMAQWRAGYERAGLEIVSQEQVRAPGDEPGWQHEVGTLVTVGRRP